MSCVIPQWMAELLLVTGWAELTILVRSSNIVLYFKGMSI